MINLLSYIGMNLQAEVCLWTLLGLIRTIFDATLFRVNANLKQVWQMTMPEQLSMPVQRVLRTMISGVMLVQCFTVYVYLASYIVLLYPVFLEERPTLVLPWLLLAAIRKLLCELTSLALGLGTCVLVGPTRPSCIKFVIIKLISIMPAFYTWMLLFSYYHTLKLAAAFKTFPAVLPASDHDYGLELAIRRRRTKSLLGEDQLRSKLVASLYGEPPISADITSRSKIVIPSRMMHSTDTSAIDMKEFTESLRPMSVISKQVSDTGSNEDWFGSEVAVPRGTDRILEQFVLMMLRIGAYLDKEGIKGINSQMFNSKGQSRFNRQMHCSTISNEESETPPQVGSIRGNTASYLRDYPQIFMKKSADVSRTDNNPGTITIQTRHESEEDGNVTRTRKLSISITSKEKMPLDVEKIVSNRKHVPKDNHQHRQSTTSSTSARKQRTKSNQLSICSSDSEDKNNTHKNLTKNGSGIPSHSSSNSTNGSCKEHSNASHEQSAEQSDDLYEEI